MTYKLMSVNDLLVLYDRLVDHGDLDTGSLAVKLNLEGEVYQYWGDPKSHSYSTFNLFLQTGGRIEVEAKELYVKMTYQTYQLHKLVDNADYELALAVFEQYFASTPDSEEGRFAYLLGLIIADYESQHYPIAISSTVDFIDHLLEERQLQWEDVRTALGYHRSISIPFLKTVLAPLHIRCCDVVKLSHFFKLPIQAFIVGGYRD